MKERRRPKRNRSASKESVTKKVEKEKRPAVGCDPVEVPAGEDKESFKRHNMGLDTLYAKFTKNNEQLSRQDFARVEQLMELSYAMRRNNILQDGHSFTIKQKYPFLQHYEHVS